jgi:hypothetical protein
MMKSAYLVGICGLRHAALNMSEVVLVGLLPVLVQRVVLEIVIRVDEVKLVMMADVQITMADVQITMADVQMTTADVETSMAVVGMVPRG